MRRSVAWVLWLLWSNDGWKPYIQATRPVDSKGPSGKAFLWDWAEMNFPRRWDHRGKPWRSFVRVLPRGSHPAGMNR